MGNLTLHWAQWAWLRGIYPYQFSTCHVNFFIIGKKVRCMNYLLYEYKHPACSCKCWNQGISDQCQYFVWMGLVVGKKWTIILKQKKCLGHTHSARCACKVVLQPGANFFWFRQALNLALFLIFHVGILHCVSVLPSAGQFFTENPAEHGIWKKRFGERM